jgi:NAD(P)-dependent dehydrogenase (short-subunit alcohol dehydrogenase family)
MNTLAQGSAMKVLVLGGKGAIGSAIAGHFTAYGHVAKAVGRGDFDLAIREEILDYFAREPADFDVLVHSAGWNIPRCFEESSDDDIRQSMGANLFGFLSVVRTCLPHWKTTGYGRIVVISSLYGFLGRHGRLPYVASKHALNGAVKTLAIELAPHGVLVNSVSPGYISTDLTFRNNSRDKIDALVTGIPMGRLGTPLEIAKVVAFLGSPNNTYINGQDLIADGGFSIGGFQ